jgi:hypothetical protein
VAYDPAEQTDIIEAFAAMLALPTRDGGRKREKQEKVPWTVDPSHRDAMYRHLKRWETGDIYDEDSGANALVHVAWRALALAHQQDTEA